MPRFFTEKSNINEDTIIITGSDAIHIGRSLRMRLGDEITVCCDGTEYFCSIKKISNTAVICQIISSKKGENEADVNITLFQALPKSDKLDFIVQKATELGADQIVPVLTSRCISRPDQKSFVKKLDRLNKIALEASKQCGRSKILNVMPLISFDNCIMQMKNFDYPLMCYEKGGQKLNDIGLKNNTSIAVLIGSEGGFAPEEAQKAIDSGITAIGLGKRILRCETAPIAALSIIMNLTGNI